MFASRLVGLLAVSCLLASVGPARADDKKKPDTQAPADNHSTGVKRVTIQEKEIELSKALAEITKQTGNEVVDRRQGKDDVKIRLDLKGVTFWQALDAVAKAADANVAVFERDMKVALTDGPFQALPTSYDGMFRIRIKRIQIAHNLETDGRQALFTMEIAWEPRFQPLFIEGQADDLYIEDDKGRTVELPEPNRGQASTSKRNAVEVIVRTNAPQRTANSLKVLKGKLMVTGPSEVLTFTWDKLSKIDKKADYQKKTNKGVSVTLRELRQEGAAGDQVWTVGLFLEYPPDGPKFESFQSWIVNNEIHFVREKDGLKQQMPPNLGYETDDQSDTKALIRYRFGDEPDRKVFLGKFGDWSLVYKTPGRVVEVPVNFEFKGLALP
jgi:hypothetical protein